MVHHRTCKAKRSRRPAVYVSISLLAFGGAAQAQTIRRVDGDNGLPMGDGLAWSTAYKFLQDALADAALHPNLNPYQIWVAAAAQPYRPDVDAAHQNGSDPTDRTATFRLLPNISLYGGFAGGENSLTQRNPAANVTVLSGDVGLFVPPCGTGGCYVRHTTVGCDDGDCCAAVCEQLPGQGCCSFGTWTGQCAQLAQELCPIAAYHVVSAEDIVLGIGDRPPRLDGFTITGGSANVAEGNLDAGGGMLISNANPILVQCTFQNNLALRGGAVAVLSGEPIVASCAFFDNTARGTSLGGAIYNAGAAQLVNCIFSGNIAQTSTGKGGAIYNAGTVKLVNCTLTLNTAGTQGTGGGVASATGGGPGGPLVLATVANSIVYGNTPVSAQILGPAVVSYSDVQQAAGVFPGTENINAPPNFVAPGSDDLRLQLGSLCIDAGNNSNVPGDTADLDGDGRLLEQVPVDFAFRPRFAHDTMASGPTVCENGPVNMGAFESGNCDYPIDTVPDDQEVDTNGDGVPDDCQDCNNNGQLDPLESGDCNNNGIADVCDILGMCSIDRDADGVPDECECDPDKVDIVFIVDTSTSMNDDFAAICATAKQVVDDLGAFPNCLDVRADYLGITVTPACANFPGTVGNVAEAVSSAVPGDAGACGQTITVGPGPDEESWGQATAIVAAYYPWRPCLRRVIVPISDEGPCRGDDPCDTSVGSADRDSIENAIVQSDQNLVFVFPITAGFDQSSNPVCVRFLAALLGTGAESATLDLEAEGSWDQVGDKLRDDILELANACVDPCPADLDGDGQVGIVDLFTLLGNYQVPGQGPCTDCASCLGDFNGDRIINIVEFLTLLGSWGPCPPCGSFLVNAGDGGAPGNADLIAALNLLGFDDLAHFDLWALSAQEMQVVVVGHLLATIVMGQAQ